MAVGSDFNISWVFGITNLYQDISAEDINEGLSVLESQADQIVSDLHNVLHTGTFSLGRRDLNRLQRLFIIHYRSPRRTFKLAIEKTAPSVTGLKVFRRNTV